MAHIIAYDIGSTGCKTCLYHIGDQLVLKASAMATYRFTTLPGGGVEQDPQDWWKAMASTTRQVLAESGLPAHEVKGISFCAQMQGLVLVDASGMPLRPAMSYMDQRGGEQQARVFGRGLRIEGVPLLPLLHSLRVNGAVAASVKDPVWKYLWVRDHEPELFARVHKWLDVKDFLTGRATGTWTMTRDSAFATFLTDERKKPSVWDRGLMKIYGVDPAHMPLLVDATQEVGPLLPGPAAELGLAPGTAVFGGGGDAALIAVGAGATDPGDCHVYTGTSGWVSTVVTRQAVDVERHVAAIVGARPGHYHYFGEQETAGKCLEWVKDHLALDEINLFLEKTLVTESPEARYESLYEFLLSTIEQVPPGSGGVIFTPWLHGNRSPFEDPSARGMFFNLSLSTGKRAMIRAVVEGIVFHQKWLFESVCARFPAKGPLRFVGGGALSPLMAQIMADILERPVQTVAHPQNCGAAGAALTAGIGLGLVRDYPHAKAMVPALATIEPSAEHRGTYRRHYDIFKKLWRHNRPLFDALNSKEHA